MPGPTPTHSCPPFNPDPTHAFAPPIAPPTNSCPTPRAAIPVVTCVLAIVIESRIPSRQEATALMVLTGGVMIAVWQGTVAGKPYAIMLCIAGAQRACG
jgi:hypothetical protein